MRRIYQQQCRRGPKPWRWERFYLRDLPKRGPGSVVAPNHVGGPFIKRRAAMLAMRPGELLYTWRCRFRVVER